MKLNLVSARLFLAAGLLVTLSGCGFDPVGDVPLQPPAVYQEWWAKTEACSGRTGNFDRISWSTIEGYSFPCSSGQCAGHWRTNHHIFLAGDCVTAVYGMPGEATAYFSSQRNAAGKDLPSKANDRRD